ncbi:MAG: hypothetical protein SWH61_08770 [Thermodesulfobacteriota bacterium]|nr:hypothetical protein [Thermodesulfobacteriota bacterium]
MRGAFFVVIVIALLIVTFLVVKNLSTETADGTTKMETIQKAKDTVNTVEEKTKALSDRINDATKGIDQ